MLTSKTRNVAIVPAAGKGTRLGYHLPKVLFEIHGKTILEHLYERLRPICSEIILVVSPDGKNILEKFIKEKELLAISLAVQGQPLGMADAILAAKNHEPADHFLILWGDQIGISASTIHETLSHHISANNDFTFPVYGTKNPYVHYVREGNQITKVLQRREGDLMPDEGFTDAGFFISKGTNFFKNISEYILKDESSLGHITKEKNFLPFIPWLSKKNFKIEAIQNKNMNDTLGINSKEDVETWKANECS